MKKNFVFFLLVVFLGNVQAQGFIKAGWGIRSMHMEALDIVINSYNDSRTWLDEKMPYINYTNGYSIGFGFMSEKREFSLSHIGNWRTVSASGIQPANSTFAQRDLYLRYNQFQMPIIWYPSGGKLGIGASVDVGYLRFKTKLTGQNEYDAVQKDLKVGSSLLLKFITSKEKPGLSFTLSLHTPYFATDFYTLDTKLNPVDSYYTGEKGNPVQIGFTMEYYLIMKN
ncbi:MAG: hypothetical protein ACKOXB_04670 [Flavobacteriales bacterium]